MSAMTATTTGGLLEREDEVAQLATRLDAAAAGDGSVVAIEGAAGIGKSMLVAAAVQRAGEAGMLVLSARCGELEQDFGYGVVRQLFGAPLAAMSSEERGRSLSGAAGLAAAALSVGETETGHCANPGAVLHGLYWLTANLAAEQPLLIVVDDAHWADSASIAFLSYLARRIEGLASLVVYATRVAEGAGDVLPASAEPGLVGTVLRPRVLSDRATAELVGRLLGADSSEEFARACQTATGGNPFLLGELLRALQADGIVPSKESCDAVARIAPDTISRAILARLRRLGATATALAFAVAVLGRSADLRHAAALADLDLGAAGEAADALTRAAVLRDARPLEFIHPVVRTTIYAEIPAAQRAASHRRAAQLLESEGAAPAELAAHLLATDPIGDPAVVECLRAAAVEVRDRGANDAACAYLARALAEPPRAAVRADILFALGSAALAVGRADAIGCLREALEGDLDPGLRLAAGLEFTAALVHGGQVAQGIELLEELGDGLVADGEVEAAMQIEGRWLCVAQLDPATCGRVTARLARYEGRLRGDSNGERLLLTSMAFDAAHRQVSSTYAADLAERGLAGGRLLLEQYPHAANFVLATWTLVVADRLERADQLMTLAIEHALARGSVLAFAIATAHRCHVRLRQGQIADAEAEARSCLEGAGHAWILGRPLLIACVLDAMVERTGPEACRTFLAEQDVEEDLATGAATSRLLLSRGHHRLVAGDPAGALRDFEQIRSRELRSGREMNGFATRGSMALAHARLGEHEHARELAEQELERARIWGAPSTLSFALRVAGTVAGGDEGIELLRQAASSVAHSPALYERALALTEYGAALRRAGHRREAREPLREALALADRGGAHRTAARARDELLASGARPRRAALTGADSLTPSERRVCRLAGDGLTNREIAQALFVTVRTVEGHLRQAYIKLDISRREQLAPALQSAT
jgi:DNA-binding CsgD family transcriptional regulator